MFYHLSGGALSAGLPSSSSSSGERHVPPPLPSESLQDLQNALAEKDSLIIKMQTENMLRREKIRSLEEPKGSRVWGRVGKDKDSDHSSKKKEPHKQQVVVPPPPSTPPPTARPTSPPPPSASSFPSSTVLLIFTYRRAEYLSRCFSHILPVIPPGLRVFVSQDGAVPAVTSAIEKATQDFRLQGNELKTAQHEQKMGENGYQLLSQHYKFGLEKAFAMPGVERVIVLEEDLQVARDFFIFFEVMAPLLDAPDSNLLCISAWNDNGMSSHVSSSSTFVRSDFFPGLGWMLTRSLHDELIVKWPRGYWDDWLREPPQRRNRQTIRPEVSRTFHYGQQGGTSSGEYSSYLDSIQLSTDTVNWSSLDVSLLGSEVAYDAALRVRVEQAERASDRAGVERASGDVRVEYVGLSSGPNCFERVAERLGIMANIKANVPRTAYKGVVQFRKNNSDKEFFVFVTPPLNEIQWKS